MKGNAMRCNTQPGIRITYVNILKQDRPNEALE
jgi:hypothetical protein